LHLTVQAKLVGITARTGGLSGVSGRADERNCQRKNRKGACKSHDVILQCGYGKMFTELIEFK
jgi:hypothetical protein